ncbi:hypothetical protein V494_06825 [Pseudogymnoascus sp. VKM F-4513 (FW-928)]|nr:hypothetical protein V494_06825 [Pseudogymnoascus sp. VKM F-4513 (FW-928)]
MSAPSPPGMGLAGKLPERGLIIIVWVATGLAGCFVVARTAIRIKKIEKLHVDDYLIYTAFLVLIANAVLQTIQAPHCYNLARLVNGLSTLTEEETVASGNTYLRYEFTIIGLFWTVLWLVKASFLAFFYMLFDGLQVYRRIWWGVVVFAFLSYVGCWIVSINVCHPARNYFVFGACSLDIDKKTSIVAVLYSTVVDVLTDIMIMAMPLRLLWKVHISKSEKMGLAGVFGIGVLIIVFAIARAVQIAFTTTSDSVLLALWGIIESTVSVIVGCLPPFKSLFTRRLQTSYNTSYEDRYNKSALTNELRNGSIPLQSRTSQTTKIHRGHITTESTEDIVGYLAEDLRWKSGRGGISVRQEAHVIGTDKTTPIYDMASITSLPTEILSDILSYLPREPYRESRIPCLSVYATVCKRWQQLVELRTFQEIVVKSCELEYLSTIMTERRRSALKSLNYSIALSQEVDDICSKGTDFRDEAVEAAEESFKAGLVNLFTLLKEWETYDSSMSLCLDITGFTTYERGQETKTARCNGKRLNSPYGYYLSDLRLGHLLLQLRQSDDLPKLKSVATLYISGYDPICMTADSMTRIAIDFSSLTTLCLQLNEQQSNDFAKGDVQEFWYKFSVSLLSLVSLPLTRFFIGACADYEEGYCHCHEPASILRHSTPDIDFFCLALYAISVIPTMKEMGIHNFLISEQLFQPPANIPMDSEFAYLAERTLKWPSLIVYSIQFSCRHPSGSWYFVRHPDNPPVPHNHASCKFRTYPNNKPMNNLLGAAGKAKCNMPSLRVLSLVAHTGDDDWQFQARWSNTGVYKIGSRPLFVPEEGLCPGGKPYRYIPTERDWYPEKGVEDAWAGRKN